MATTRLCATVAASTMEELRAARDAQTGADLVELRLDLVERPDVQGALADRRTPVIVTVRPEWEGGSFAGSEDERRGLLLAAIDAGADYVDVEHAATFASDIVGRRHGRGVVLSSHAFDGVPADLESRYRAMRSTGAEVVKLAARVDRLVDGLRVMRVGAPTEARVLIAMGAAGVPTRLLASRVGMSWSYAGAGVAPGQIELDRMRGEYRFHRVTERTAVYGVVGSPIGHSVSPAMHNAGFRALDIDAIYLPLEAADADDFCTFAQEVGLRGASVTAPFKESFDGRLDVVDDAGCAVGAINTIRMDDAGWKGRNTDVDGFLAPLDGQLELDGIRAAVLGAGGAARGVVWGLAREGAKVQVCARRSERAGAVARAVGATVGTLPPVAGSWDLLVNTTPAGTAPALDETPLPDGTLDGRVVYDLVYNPSTTRLMREAAAAGCDTIGGLPMLVAQAERQFEWWTGQSPPPGVFLSAARDDLARRRGAGIA